MGNVKLVNGLLNDCYRFVTNIDLQRPKSEHWKDEQCTSALKKEREKPIQFFSIHISPMWNLGNTDGQYDYHKFSRIKNVHWRALPTHPDRSYTLYFVFHISRLLKMLGVIVKL